MTRDPIVMGCSILIGHHITMSCHIVADGNSSDRQQLLERIKWRFHCSLLGRSGNQCMEMESNGMTSHCMGIPHCNGMPPDKETWDDNGMPHGKENLA